MIAGQDTWQRWSHKVATQFYIPYGLFKHRKGQLRTMIETLANVDIHTFENVQCRYTNIFDCRTNDYQTFGIQYCDLPNFWLPY